MDTIANNETMNLKKSNNNVNAGKVGVAAGGAGAILGGVAGAAIAGLDADAAPVEDQQADTEIREQHARPHHDTTSQTTTQVTDSVVEETPEVTDGPDVQVEDSSQSLNGETVTTDSNVTENDDVVIDDNIDPNDVALEIIAGEEIDPNDINAADVFDIAEVGTIYGADGEEYNGMYATDINGNEIVMIDVDGDVEYDLITDVEGNVLAQGDTGINVSDAELQLNNAATYMAADDTNSLIAPENMVDDIITT